MKQKIGIKYFFCFLSFIISACSSTKELKSIDEVRMKICEGRAIIQLKSGTDYKGRIIKMSGDSIQFLNTRTDSTLQLSFQDIKYFKVKNHLTGALEGFLIGGASLSVPSAILLSSMTTGENDHSLSSGVILYGTLIGTGVGSLSGVLIGSLLGHRYTYIYSNDSTNIGAATYTDSTKIPINQISR